MVATKKKPGFYNQACQHIKKNCVDLAFYLFYIILHVLVHIARSASIQRQRRTHQFLQRADLPCTKLIKPAILANTPIKQPVYLGTHQFFFY